MEFLVGNVGAEGQITPPRPFALERTSSCWKFTEVKLVYMVRWRIV
jgi:hypothetical protein